MIDRELYTPGPASGARVQKDRGQNREEKWTLILVRELRHSPEKVWDALTDTAHLRESAPFDADGSLGTVGNMKRSEVRLRSGGDAGKSGKLSRQSSIRIRRYRSNESIGTH